MSMLLNALHKGGTDPFCQVVHNVHSRHVNCLRGVAASLVSGPSGARR